MFSISFTETIATELDKTDFGVSFQKLENGMDVVIIPNHRAPVVYHMVWYRVGAADDPVGKSGLSHFLEHLMFKGTERFPDGTFSELVARNGGRENAFTSPDYTGYFQHISKDHLSLVMELEADRMTNLSLTQTVVEIERDVILEERSARTDNSPGALLSETMNAMLYLNHPYGTPTIGWRHEIEQLTLNDIEGFYEKYYSPNNAILVIAGDVDPAKVFASAKKYYGAIPSRQLNSRVRIQEPKSVASRKVTSKNSRVSEPSITRFYLAPSYLSGNPKEVAALEVLSELLGGKITSRLYRDLVVDKKLATWAGAGYYPSTLDLTKFSIYVSLNKGGNIGDAEAALDEIISEFLLNNIDMKKLEAAKKRMLATRIYALDSPSSIAHIYGGALATGMEISDIEHWARGIESVSAKDVLKAAKNLFKEENSVTGFLIPSKELK